MKPLINPYCQLSTFSSVGENSIFLSAERVLNTAVNMTSLANTKTSLLVTADVFCADWKLSS